jgi:hypothetical protein
MQKHMSRQPCCAALYKKKKTRFKKSRIRFEDLQPNMILGSYVSTAGVAIASEVRTAIMIILLTVGN